MNSPIRRVLSTRQLTRDATTLAAKTNDLESYKLELMNLEESKGQPDYIAQIDDFVADAGALTLDRILEYSGADDLLKTRIRLFQLKSELADLEEFKDTPDYSAYVQLAISEAPNEVRQALQNEQNLNDEIATALYESFSDTLDEPAENASQVHDKPDSTSTRTAAIMPPNHPGMG